MDPSNIKGFDQLWVWAVITLLGVLCYSLKALMKNLMKNSDIMLERTNSTCEKLVETNSKLVELTIELKMELDNHKEELEKRRNDV